MAKTACEKTAWVDDKIDLLLRFTLKYEASKLHNNVDWELCQSKFADILVI